MNTAQNNVKRLNLWEKFSGEPRSVELPIVCYKSGEAQAERRVFRMGLGAPKRYRFDLDWQAALERENATFPEMVKESLDSIYNLAIKKDIPFFELFLYALDAGKQPATTTTTTTH